MKRMIVLGLTGLTERGGIQNISKFYVSALSSYTNEMGLGYKILCLKDSKKIQTITINNKEYVVKCYNGNRILFTLGILSLMRRTNIILFNHVNLSPIGMLMKMGSKSLKYIVLAHGREVWGRISRVNKIGLFNADKIIAVSQFTKLKIVGEQNVSETKVEVIANCINQNVINKGAQTSPKRFFPKHAKKLLTVGRLNISEPGKGVDKVFEIMPRLLKYFQEVHYIVVGRGSLKLELMSMAKKLNISNQVSFLDDVEDDDLSVIYKEADVFVMPGRQEGFGLVYLEALCQGTPVIGSTLDGSSEPLMRGELGALVNPDAPNELFNTVVDILEKNPKKYVDSDRLVRMVQQHFSYGQFEEKIKYLIDNL